MAASPALSPRPNPPGPGGRRALPSMAKPLAILHSTASTPMPEEEGQDQAVRMNDQVRQRYVSGQRLGEGTYAVVYSGHLRTDPTKLFAIKKIKVQQEYKDGITMDAIREIKYLQELDHPNIIKLHAVYSTKDQNLSLVLEFLPLGDLEGLWKNTSINYSGADIKAWANMLCQAVWFCHENSVLHRDIKGNNLLIAADGTVKLADFGLARSFADPGRPMTYNVITRWYRPPELLYGARFYSGKVDVWSMAVVICELAGRNFFLMGNTDLEQLALICHLFGVPTEDTWPGVSQLDFYVSPREQKDREGKSLVGRKPQTAQWWRQRFPLLGDDGVDLVRGCLAVDPKKRCSARDVLNHKYWTTAPRPTLTEDLPRQGGGEKKMGEDLKRRGGEVESGRGDKVARKLNFGA